MGYDWFVEPLNKETNDLLASALEETSFCENIFCEDGHLHNLWQCTAPLISYLKGSRRRISSIRFRVFSRKGQGEIRECTFLYL